MIREALVIQGVKLEIARWKTARRDRLPILLMHEGLGSIDLWKHFPKALAETTGREVIAWSRQGHGWSDRIRDPRCSDYMHREAQLLPELHHLLAIDRAHWLGHSDGGSIALIGAAWFPELAESLILEAPHVFVEDITLSKIAGIGLTYSQANIGERMKRYHADPDHIFREWNDIWLDPAFRDWNIEELLPQICAPTLLIQGHDDEYGTMEQLDRIATVLSNVKRIELQQCGHSPHRDREDTVTVAIRDFLDNKD